VGAEAVEEAGVEVRRETLDFDGTSAHHAIVEQECGVCRVLGQEVNDACSRIPKYFYEFRENKMQER